MPKKAFVISSFKGLQSEYDPRDIEQGALVTADDIFIDKPGKIRLARVGEAYSPGTNIIYNTGNSYRGYGLFQFGADYEQDGTAGDTDYLLVQNGSLFALAENYNATAFDTATDWIAADQDSTVFDLGTADASVKPSYYYVDGALRICDGTHLSSGNKPKWLGYISRTHFTDLTPGGSADTYTGWYFKDQECIAPTAGTLGDGVSPSYPSAGNGVSFKVISNLNDTLGSFPADTYNFAISFVYDKIQESKLYIYSEDITLSDIGYFSFEGFLTSPFNPRITHCNLYIRNDIGSEWIHIGIADLTDGFKTVTNEEYRAWSLSSGSEINGGGGVKSIHELSSTTYEMNSGIDADEDNTFANYKTSCITNRRTYIGNVRIDNVNYGDKMIKSPVNKFDIFPESNNIDVVINDGDEIVRLIVLSDKILQFKRKNLYVINVADDYEYIEETFKNHGIDEPFQACEIENGVAWCNQLGVFIYSNNKLEEISANIKDAWQAFFVADSFNSLPSIGYDARQKKLVIANSVGYKSRTQSEKTGNAYIFDMVVGAWTKSKSMFEELEESDKWTNFITDVNGYMLVFRHDVTDDESFVYSLATADHATSSLSIITSDMVIDDISVKKRFYGIKITYKASVGIITPTNIKVQYGIDGISPATALSPKLTANLMGTAGLWSTVNFGPASLIDFYSIAVKIYSDGSCAAGFEINDISILYRPIGIR